MPSRERLVHVGTRRGERLAREYAEEIREARLLAGLSQGDVAAAVGISTSTLSRMENAQPPLADFVAAARVARVVGLDLTVRCFPAGGPLRDAAHLALVTRFLAELHASIARRIEEPIPMDRDQRAWDVLLRIGPVRIGVAAETRLRDVQSLIRRERAKQRDSSTDRLLLVVAATRGNRRALREAAPILDETLPLRTRAVLHALHRGEDPGGDGLVLI